MSEPEGETGIAAKTRCLGTSPDDIALAAGLLAAGKLVAFPTETVYGLGADATRPEAVARIFAAKGRPRFNPLIAHVAETAEALSIGDFNEAARRLAARFWPGPLTLVVPAGADCPVCDLARAGLDSVAIRVPAHPVARALIAAAGVPIVAPSANRSGHVSASDAAHVLSDLSGRIEALVDGGPAEIGLESTIVAALGDALLLLRPGAIGKAAIEAVAGQRLERPGDQSEEAPLAPGRLASHYAPRARLRLEAREIRPGEAYLGFGEIPADCVPLSGIINLSARADLLEAASSLYRSLRLLDALQPMVIAVAPIPNHGLGEAINDRLVRAAAPKQ